MRRPITREKFSWEGNTHGITDRVYPPFMPIDVHGDTLRVVLREYQIDGLGFLKCV